MVAELEEVEAHLEFVPPLQARQYRQLWLDVSDELGLVAETLACALGWQASETEPLPDALELAQAVYVLIKQPTAGKTRHIAFLLNQS